MPHSNADMAANILMVTPNFPPYAMAGAARTGALARHWARQGRRVTVLAAAMPGAHGIHKSLDIDGIIPEFLPIDRDGADAGSGEASPAKPPALHRPKTSMPGPLRRILWDLQAMPDRYNPHWAERAATRGIALAREAVAAGAAPLIYSSGPPNSAHIVAAKIKQATGLRWISEQRDLWIDNPYTSHHWLTEMFNNRMARRILPAADAFVGVTQTAVAELEHHFAAPVRLAYNGLDPEDFAETAPPAPYDAERLTIIHAGVIYAGRRDPRPLFAALALLPAAQSAKVRILFFHDEYDYVTRLAKEYDVLSSVEFRALLPREEILQLERQVDILLVCRSHDSKGAGVIPGKVFEYIGARRPMLAIGSEQGEAVDIIRAGNFGLISNDPQEIAAQLVQWLEQKQAHGGRVPDLPEAPTKDYVRTLQFAKVDALIDQVLGRNVARSEKAVA